MRRDYNFVSLFKDATTTKEEFANNVKRGERGKEPLFTTFKTRSSGTMKHTIDYIFEKYCNDENEELKNNSNDNDSENTLNVENGNENGVWTVTEYWEMPETDKVIPNWFYPSDHFSLCLQLTWNK